MPMATSPFDVAQLPSTEGALWVYGLIAVPLPPVTLAKALGVKANIPPALLNYVAQPNHLEPVELVTINGTAELRKPLHDEAPPPIVALAIVAYNPPFILLGTSELPEALVLTSETDLAETSVSLTVARTPVIDA